MTTQRQNSSARPANIAQQQLQNGRRADDLHAFRMLGPPHCVADRSRLLRTRRRSERLCSFQKYVLRYTAEALDHFRRVAREMSLQHLKHAARIFQRYVPFKVAYFLGLAAPVFTMTAAVLSMSRKLAGVFLRGTLVQPRLWIVLLSFLVPA